MRVANASPLIHLARVSLLDLLRDPEGSVPVFVPSVVFDEVMRGASHDPAEGLVAEAARDWPAVVDTPPPPAEIRRVGIDAGELAVLSLARNMPGSSVVLDDLAARAEADRLGIPKPGTLRLLLDAKADRSVRFASRSNSCGREACDCRQPSGKRS